MAYVLAYGMVSCAANLALMMVLWRHGQSVEAVIRYVYRWQKGFGTLYAFEYIYNVNNIEYSVLNFASAEFALNKKTHIRRLYLLQSPHVSGPHLVPFMRFGLMTIITLASWYCATMIGFMILVDARLIYTIWLFNVVLIYRHPEMTTNPKLRRFFFSPIPKRATRTEIDPQGQPLVSSK